MLPRHLGSAYPWAVRLGSNKVNQWLEPKRTDADADEAPSQESPSAHDVSYSVHEQNSRAGMIPWARVGRHHDNLLRASFLQRRPITSTYMYMYPDGAQRRLQVADGQYSVAPASYRRYCWRRSL